MSAQFARIVAQAKADSGLSSALFYFSLARPGAYRAETFAARSALGNAIYQAANVGHVDDDAWTKHLRSVALTDQLADEIDELTAYARSLAYSGWSIASREPVKIVR